MLTLLTTEVKEGNVIVRKLLLSPEKLRQLPDNEVIILCKNKRPVKDEMIRNF